MVTDEELEKRIKQFLVYYEEFGDSAIKTFVDNLQQLLKDERLETRIALETLNTRGV